jgi:hypothetical protein
LTFSFFPHPEFGKAFSTPTKFTTGNGQSIFKMFTELSVAIAEAAAMAAAPKV